LLFHTLFLEACTVHSDRHLNQRQSYGIVQKAGVKPQCKRMNVAFVDRSIEVKIAKGYWDRPYSNPDFAKSEAG
jgi:hypothetical protein